MDAQKQSETIHPSMFQVLVVQFASEIYDATSLCRGKVALKPAPLVGAASVRGWDALLVVVIECGFDGGLGI